MGVENILTSGPALQIHPRGLKHHGIRREVLCFAFHAEPMKNCAADLTVGVSDVSHHPAALFNSDTTLLL